MLCNRVGFMSIFQPLTREDCLRLLVVVLHFHREMKSVYKQGTQNVDEFRLVLDALTHTGVIWRPFEDHRQHHPFDDNVCTRVTWNGMTQLYYTYLTDVWVSLDISNTYRLHLLILTHLMWILSGLHIMQSWWKWYVREFSLPPHMMWMLIIWIDTIGCHILVWYHHVRGRWDKSRFQSMTKDHEIWGYHLFHMIVIYIATRLMRMAMILLRYFQHYMQQTLFTSSQAV